jgi:UPF0271 protein
MTISINSDIGESFGIHSFGNDERLLPLIDTANVACGFHAGDAAGILATLRRAKERNVAVGAHVSYPDLAGFGRRNMDVASADLVADVIYQIGALQALAAAAGTSVRYVKPHGALYNTIAHEERQARDVIAAIRAVDSGLWLVGLAGSPLLGWAEAAGLRTISEAFADRAYTAGGALVSRREKGAVLHDPEQVAARMLRLASDGVVSAIDGSTVRLRADSICVHGDSPGAVEMARQVRELLERSGVTIRAFADADADANTGADAATTVAQAEVAR